MRDEGSDLLTIEPHHARPFVGAFQVRSWSHYFVLGAILWAFIAKNDKVSEELTLRYPHEGPCVASGAPPRPRQQPRGLYEKLFNLETFWQ